MTTPTTLTIVLPGYPNGRGWIQHRPRLSAVPEIGTTVEIVSSRGFSYGTGTIVECPWVIRGNALARVRTWQTTLRVHSHRMGTRSYKGETWEQPMFMFDVEFTLEDPVNIYGGITVDEANALLPECYRVKSPSWVRSRLGS